MTFWPANSLNVRLLTFSTAARVRSLSGNWTRRDTSSP